MFDNLLCNYLYFVVKFQSPRLDGCSVRVYNKQIIITGIIGPIHLRDTTIHLPYLTNDVESADSFQSPDWIAHVVMICVFHFTYFMNCLLMANSIIANVGGTGRTGIATRIAMTTSLRQVCT